MVAALDLPRSSQRRDAYWANEPDPELMVHECLVRRDAFWKLLEQSNIVDSVWKLWRFYHGLFYDLAGGSVVPGGEYQDLMQLASNEFRSRLNLLLTYTTTEQVDWDAQADDTSKIAFEQTKAANALLDYGMDAPQYQMEEALKQAAEHAIVYRVGYTACMWDDTLGQATGGDTSTLRYEYQGDASIFNPTVFDVIFDPVQADHRKRKWYLFRKPELRWDLAEIYYDKRDEIIGIANDPQNKERFRGMDRGLVLKTELDDDQIDKWYFMHLPCHAMPEGRMLCFVGDRTPLYDTVLPKFYKRLPIHRLVHSNMVGTSLIGHSPAVDLAPLQEALNIDLTTILTNHVKFGQQKIWAKWGEDFSEQEAEPGSIIVRTNTPVQALNLLQTAPELLAFPKDLTASMDNVSGVAAVSRGVMEKQTSGVAAALLDMKTIQANSRFDQNYKRHVQDVGQGFLEIFQAKALEPISIPAIGEDDRRQMLKISAENLQMVNHVLVKPGNAAMRTAAGKMNLAQMILQIPDAISNPRELITILEGGDVDKLWQAEDSQIKLVNEENEAMKKGNSVPGSITDDHLYHCKAHVASILGSVDSRYDSNVVLKATAHILWHINQVSQNPMAKALMLALGWAKPDLIQAFGLLNPAPLPAPGMGNVPPSVPGAPPGAGPAPEGPPNGPGEPEKAPPEGPQGNAGTVKKILKGARQHLQEQAGQARGAQAQAVA